MVGAIVADVVLRGSQVAPVRRRLHAAGIDRHGTLADAGGARFHQQSLNDLLGALVLALAEVMLANLPTRIDEVKSRPILVLECPPDRIVVVDRDRVVDLHLLQGASHVVEVLSNVNSGVCTPITTSPCRYFCAQARTYGSVRSQLMHV